MSERGRKGRAEICFEMHGKDAKIAEESKHGRVAHVKYRYVLDGVIRHQDVIDTSCIRDRLLKHHITTMSVSRVVSG